MRFHGRQWGSAGEPTPSGAADPDSQRRLILIAVLAGLVTLVMPLCTLMTVRYLGHQSVIMGATETVGLLAVSAAAGFAIGVAAYVVPMAMIRRQAALVSRSIEREVAASTEIAALNKMLAQKVGHAVAEIRDLSGRMLDVQEEERRRVARELHDGVGQSLTALRLVLDAMQQDGNPTRLKDAMRMCDESVQALRQAVYDLQPPEIGTTPLPDIFQSYCERFEVRSGIATSFRWRGNAIASEAVATCLLRVLQEAFTNISKHANAKEVGVSVLVGESMAELRVQDDGRGFETETPKAGNGLRSIRERSAFFGGDCRVESRKGVGTRVTIRIPLGRKIGAAVTA